jgi:NADH-quinone oxidoreductase subunit A
MPLEYLPVLILITLALLVAIIAITLGTLFGPRRPTEKKAMPYESGMVPYGPGTRRMNVRYYLIAVLFILFDIEVVFLLPYAVSYRGLGLAGLVFIVVFVVMLEVAHLYAWRKGALEWD